MTFVGRLPVSSAQLKTAMESLLVPKVLSSRLLTTRRLFWGYMWKSVFS